MSSTDMAKLLSLFKDQDDAHQASGCDMCGGDHDLEEECQVEEDWDNGADDTSIGDMSDVMLKGNDLHKSKKSYKAKASPGDPPVADEMTEQESRIKAELTALYKLQYVYHK